jgi:TatD DNase family protein
MRISDSHNHLHFLSYQNDIEEVMQRAQKSGIEAMLLVGIDPNDSKNAIKVSSQREGLFVSVGIHPQKANEYTSDDVMNLYKLAENSKVVAVGETGFDLYRSPDNEDVQKILFSSHIELARKLSLPLVIHDRDAHRKTLSVLDDQKAWPLGGVFHCFSGDIHMASYVIEHGFYISIPGVVTYKNALALKDVVRFCPLHSLLIETDAPFLAPRPFRGKRNEPSFLMYIIEEIAKIKECSLDDIAQNTTENFNRLFLSARGPN